MDIERGLAIPVYGLGCGGAGATSIERALAATDGVVSAYVNPATKIAYIDYDPAEADPWVLARVIDRAGYGPRSPSSRKPCSSRNGRFGGLRRWAARRRHGESADGAGQPMPASAIQANHMTERQTDGR